MINLMPGVKTSTLNMIRFISNYQGAVVTFLVHLFTDYGLFSANNRTSLNLPKTKLQRFCGVFIHGFALVCHKKTTDCSDFEPQPQPLERFYVKHFKAVFCEDKGKS